jgi:hypothetical protein
MCDLVQRKRQPVNFCSMEETFKISTTTPPTRLPEEVADLSDDSLKQLVTSRAASFYSDTPKALQVETVMSLVQGRHTFVRAGTSFGKTRISEMYFNMFQKKIVVLVLGSNHKHLFEIFLKSILKSFEKEKENKRS